MDDFIAYLDTSEVRRPGEELVARLQAKARLLGSGAVIIRDFHAGFARLPDRPSALPDRPSTGTGAAPT